MLNTESGLNWSLKSIGKKFGEYMRIPEPLCLQPLRRHHACITEQKPTKPSSHASESPRRSSHPTGVARRERRPKHRALRPGLPGPCAASPALQAWSCRPTLMPGCECVLVLDLDQSPWVWTPGSGAAKHLCVFEQLLIAERPEILSPQQKFFEWVDVTFPGRETLHQLLVHVPGDEPVFLSPSLALSTLFDGAPASLDDTNRFRWRFGWFWAICGAGGMVGR
jgi:hypothetical protein